MSDKSVISIIWNNKDYQYDGIIGKYLKVCAVGAISGGTIGAIVGTSIGLAAGIASPVIVGIAIRKIIQKFA